MPRNRTRRLHSEIARGQPRNDRGQFARKRDVVVLVLDSDSDGPTIPQPPTTRKRLRGESNLTPSSGSSSSLTPSSPDIPQEIPAVVEVPLSPPPPSMENRGDSFTRSPAPSYAPGTRAVKGIAVPTGGDTAATNLTPSSGSSSSLKRQRAFGESILKPSSGSSSPLTLLPYYVQQIQTAAKQRRAFGPKATRVPVSGGEPANEVGASTSVAKDPEQKVTKPQRGLLGPSRLPNATPDQSTPKLGSSTPDELTLTTSSSMLKRTIDTHAQSVGKKNNEANLLIDKEKSALEALSSCNALMVEIFKKGQLDLVGNPQLTSQSDNIGLKMLRETALLDSYNELLRMDTRKMTEDIRAEHVLALKMLREKLASNSN